MIRTRTTREDLVARPKLRLPLAAYLPLLPNHRLVDGELVSRGRYHVEVAPGLHKAALSLVRLCDALKLTPVAGANPWAASFEHPFFFRTKSGDPVVLDFPLDDLPLMFPDHSLDWDEAIFDAGFFGLGGEYDARISVPSGRGIDAQTLVDTIETALQKSRDPA